VGDDGGSNAASFVSIRVVVARQFVETRQLTEKHTRATNVILYPTDAAGFRCKVACHEENEPLGWECPLHFGLAAMQHPSRLASDTARPSATTDNSWHECLDSECARITNASVWAKDPVRRTSIGFSQIIPWSIFYVPQFVEALAINPLIFS
jgi:hypothetical protein